MPGLLTAFTTIGAVVALGALLARRGILGSSAQETLSDLSFIVASPALLVVVLADTDVERVLSAQLVANLVAVCATAAVTAVGARVIFRMDRGSSVVTSLCASYVNAGNVGLPIATYALGDVAYIAPVLLVQLLVLQPVTLAALEISSTTSDGRWWQAALTSLRGPLTLATLLGLALSATSTELPGLARDPLELVGNLAVPLTLLVFGASLVANAPSDSADERGVLAYLIVLKQLFLPAVAYVTGRFALGLTGADLAAVTILAALPTANSALIIATRYRCRPRLARNAIALTTVAAIPTIAAIAIALG